MIRGSYRSLRTRARGCGAPFVFGEPWMQKTSSYVPLLCLSTSATTPVRRLAAGRVVGFVEGRIGYSEWARRNGRLDDIHSIDDRYDHDEDEFMA
jgi:hypothetical protein